MRAELHNRGSYYNCGSYCTCHLIQNIPHLEHSSSLQVKYGEVTYDTTFEDYTMLTGQRLLSFQMHLLVR